MYVVYMIKNIYNGRVYVGSSKNFPQRKSTHFSHLKFNKHKNRRLQKDYNRYGGRGAFAVIEVCYANTKQKAYTFEQMLIDGHSNPYNILVAGGAVGRTYTPETLRKMSEAAKGREITADQRKKIAETRRGLKMSEEWKRKISEAHIKRYSGMDAVPHAKLTREDVYGIYEMQDNGASFKEISDKYGIAESTAASIARGSNWARAYAEYYKNDKGAV